MNDLDRVLESLLHDLRSPLGVASGYLRLLREGRMTDPAEVDRALGRAQDALRMMSTLCADASTWLTPHPAEQLNRVAAVAFVDAVADRLARADVSLTRAVVPGTMTLRDDTDRVATAVSTVLTMAVTARDARAAVAVRAADDVLRFDVTELAGSLHRAPFDPWQHGGLLVPLACRAIRHSGGRWLVPGCDGATLSIAFDTSGPTPMDGG
jgi:signal transduction histidine kinase